MNCFEHKIRYTIGINEIKSCIKESQKANVEKCGRVSIRKLDI